MKFRFCGGLDAPDWLLTEIAIVAQLTTENVRFVTQQVVAQLVDEEINYAGLQKLSTKLSLSRSDIKAALAAVNFLLDCATRYDTDRDVFDTEMQQLGLTRDTSAAILDVYFSKKPMIEDKYRAKGFKMEAPGDIRWRLDYIIGSSFSADAQTPSVRVRLAGSEKADPLQFDVSLDRFRVLLSELKTAQGIINNLEK